MIVINCKYCNKNFKIKGIGTHEAYCQMNPSKKEKSPNHGGYRKGSGRGKSGWYKGIYCDSSWELAYILYCEYHNIEVKRYDGERLSYVSDDGENHEYIPDFIINNEQIIEIKGYETEISLLKKEQYPNIVVLLKDEMNEIIKQITYAFGDNFVSLYDGIKPTRKDKKIFLKKKKVITEPKVLKKYIFNCKSCGNLFEKNPKNKDKNQYCSQECSHTAQKKFEITAEELSNLVWKYPTSTVSKMLGVSDKAIEKRCKKLCIEKPPRGYWSKTK